MSYLSRMLEPVAEWPDIPVNDERAWTSYVPVTASGARVSPETALKISTVWACVGLISDSVGMLPAILYERLGNGDRRRAPEHPLYDVLHEQPNASQTPVEFFGMGTGHALLRGNAYARIVAGARGFADQLIPLHPDKVTPQPMPGDPIRLRYKVRLDDGTTETLTDDVVFHLRGPSADGRVGLSVVSAARESLGIAIAAESYGARFFGNDSRPGGVLKTAGKLTDPAAKRLKTSWEESQGGTNRHRVAVLEEGLEWQAIGMANKDAQFLETREFQAEDICRWFRVPPHMVGLTSKSTSWGSGIEQMSLGFVTYTLMPWLVRWQQVISRDLILATRRYFVEFLTDALLRGDLLSRYNAYQIAKNIGLMNSNEMRQRENMNHRTDPGGDQYLDTPAGAPAPIPAALADTPSQNQDGDRYAALLLDAVHRAARKEAAAMSRAAKRGGDWAEAVTEFYSDHAAYLAQVLAIPIAGAEIYVAAQVRFLLDGGPAAAQAADFEIRCGATLLKLAKEAE